VLAIPHEERRARFAVAGHACRKLRVSEPRSLRKPLSCQNPGLFKGLPFLRTGETMLKSELLRAIQIEIMQRDFHCFVDEPPSRAQGGKGSVVPGCPRCKRRIGTMPQVLDHLAARSHDQEAVRLQNLINSTDYHAPQCFLATSSTISLFAS
jgi:hypothetical protein